MYHSVKTTPQKPEEVTVEYITDDTLGKWEHTTLKIYAGNCGAKVSLNGRTPQEIEADGTIEITVIGNWEAMGFTKAFIELGKKLLEI